MFGKKRNEFKLPYLGIEDQIHGFHCLFNLKGDFGVILGLDNPVLQYSADSSKYDSFHQLYTNLIKILGEGHLIQKQDIFSYNARAKAALGWRPAYPTYREGLRAILAAETAATS